MYIITFGVCLFLIGITGWDISRKWGAFHLECHTYWGKGIHVDTSTHYGEWLDWQERELGFSGVYVAALLYLCIALVVEVLL